MNFIELTDYFTDDKMFINMSHVCEFKKDGIDCTDLIFPILIDDEEEEVIRFTHHVKEEPEEIVKLINKGK